MQKLKITILDPIGLHARPASKLVKAASAFKSDIKLHFGNKIGEVKSVMNLMALGIKSGAEVEFVINGEDEVAALEELKKVIQENKLG